MDCSPPDSSVHGILQARILEWVASPFSRGIFPTQGLNPGLLHYRRILYHLSHQGNLWRKGVAFLSAKGSLWNRVRFGFWYISEGWLAGNASLTVESLFQGPPSFLRFPGGSVVQKTPANAGDVGAMGPIPGSGRTHGGGNGNLLQYSCLENPMDRGAWRATVHGVAESDTT